MNPNIETIIKIGPVILKIKYVGLLLFSFMDRLLLMLEVSLFIATSNACSKSGIVKLISEFILTGSFTFSNLALLFIY